MAIAYQGKKSITDGSQLANHIADSAHSGNFGIFFGAGASVNAGGLVMETLWKNFRTDSPESMQWLVQKKYVSESGKIIWKDGSQDFNLEKLMDSLSAATEFHTRLNDKRELRELSQIKEEVTISVIKAAMLNTSLWEEFPENDTIMDCLGSHILVLKKIAKLRQGKSNPWLFTTNYDLAIEWAAKHAKIRINKGIKDADNPQIQPYEFDSPDYKSSETEGLCKPNLVKLHGSLNWEERDEKYFELEDEEIRSILNNLESERPMLPKLLILPGSTKYVESTQFLYGEMLRKFGDFLSKSDPVLFIVGYSFGDRHVNRQLISALRFRNELKIVTYLPEFERLKDSDRLPSDLKDIIRWGGENFTVIGGGKNAFFDVFARHLP